MLGTARIRRDKRQIDLGLYRGRKLDLGLFCRVTQTLQSHLVPLGAEVESFFFLELLYQPVHDALIDVVATKVSITIRGLHLDHAFANLEDRNIEGAAAEVVDGDGLILLLVQAVGQSRSCRLVDDALYVETGDSACILRCLTLRVVEVSRYGDHSLSHRPTQIVFRSFLQLLQ